MDPAQFERLCQRILRESGFTQVEGLAAPATAGLTGLEPFASAGFLVSQSFSNARDSKVASAPGSERDFRGAMVGKADRGLILTTGVFTGEQAGLTGFKGSIVRKVAVGRPSTTSRSP